MPTAREIRERINSVSDTLKITNAMYLISSTKLRKARRDLEETEPYYYAIRSMAARILHHLPAEFKHPYLTEREDVPESQRKKGIICITADKGLAGAYNHNVLKLTENIFDSERGDVLLCVGEVGRSHFEGQRIHIEEDLCFAAIAPSNRRAREISYKVIDAFREGKYDELYIVFTRMKNSMEMEATSLRLLPLDRTQEDVRKFMAEVEDEDFSEYTLEPNAENVIDNIIPNIVGGLIFSALVEAFCSEQYARMTAMDAANKNGEELKADLSVQYNRVRQAQITQEITEVAAGEKAQRRNRTKKK